MQNPPPQWPNATGSSQPKAADPYSTSIDSFSPATDPFAAQSGGQYPPGPYSAPSGDQYSPPTDPFATSVDPYSRPGSPADPNATSVDTPGTMIARLQQAPVPFGTGTQRQQRSRMPMIVGGVAAAVIVLAGIVLLNHNSGNSPTASGTVATTSAKPSASATAAGNSAATQQQAATALAALLAQSVTDRGDVIDAVDGVQDCGSKLAHDKEVFLKAASNRSRLLSDLADMSNRSALSASMLQDLTGAWQASAEVDSDLAKWAGDAITSGCNKKTIESNASLNASYGPDSQATQDKQAFASLWNPMATRYDLTTYESSQL